MNTTTKQTAPAANAVAAPWKLVVRQDLNPSWVAVVDASGNSIFGAVATEANVARARLIAQAPTLLAAASAILEELEDKYDGTPDGGCLWMGTHIRDLRAAVAKAEGATE